MQIAIRDTKDCFYLYEVPPSRVRKQVIAPHFPEAGFDHSDDEHRDVVDLDDIESWVAQDLLETYASLNPSDRLG